jgi:hypothetical protein
LEKLTFGSFAIIESRKQTCETPHAAFTIPVPSDLVSVIIDQLTAPVCFSGSTALAHAWAAEKGRIQPQRETAACFSNRGIHAVSR